MGWGDEAVWDCEAPISDSTGFFQSSDMATARNVTNRQNTRCGMQVRSDLSPMPTVVGHVAYYFYNASTDDSKRAPPRSA